MERKQERSSRWARLTFDGDEEKFELWQAKFMGHLRLQKLKDTLETELNPHTATQAEIREDDEKNAEIYAELIQFLDDRVYRL